MVTIAEATELIKMESMGGLSNIGVEILGSKNGRTTLMGTYLASDVRPNKGDVVVEVYVNSNDNANLSSEESSPAFSDGLLEVMGEAGITPSSKVRVQLVDYKSRGVVADYKAEAVWPNTERDEVTFTVRQ